MKFGIYWLSDMEGSEVKVYIFECVYNAGDAGDNCEYYDYFECVKNWAVMEARLCEHRQITSVVVHKEESGIIPPFLLEPEEDIDTAIVAILPIEKKIMVQL